MSKPILKFKGIKFKYRHGDGCVDDADPYPWVWQHKPIFGWQKEQNGNYFFLGFCYLAWEYS